MRRLIARYGFSHFMITRLPMAEEQRFSERLVKARNDPEKPGIRGLKDYKEVLRVAVRANVLASANQLRHASEILERRIVPHRELVDEAAAVEIRGDHGEAARGEAQRHLDIKRAAQSGRALHTDRTTEQVHQTAADRQAQPATFNRAAACFVASHESLEHARL